MPAQKLSSKTYADNGWWYWYASWGNSIPWVLGIRFYVVLFLFTYKLGQKAANLAKEGKILKNLKDSPLETPLAMARFQSSQQLKDT